MTKRQRATLDDGIRKLAWSVGSGDWSVDVSPAEARELLRALGLSERGTKRKGNRK
jgi:hypothetical protein